MTDTIFTKIIKGELPSHKLYEDEHVIAFLDIHPLQPGHTLVVPKTQVDVLWELSEADYTALMHVTKQVAQRLAEVLSKRIAAKVYGLDVPHAHVHLIPIASAAEFNATQNMDSEPDHAGLAELAKRLAF